MPETRCASTLEELKTELSAMPQPQQDRALKNLDEALRDIQTAATLFEADKTPHTPASQENPPPRQ